MKDEKSSGAAEENPAPENHAGETPEQQAENPPSPVERAERERDEALKSAQAFKDQFLRKAAEFENYKRRAESDYLSTVRNANEALISALLPIIEDLTRSLKAGAPQGEGEAFYRGVELIYQKLMNIMESQGLAPFDAAGKPFDVDYHDALLQVQRDDIPAGTVVEEVARGYKLNDRVLRHAKVIVAAAVEKEPAAEDSPTRQAPPSESKESTQH